MNTKTFKISRFCFLVVLLTVVSNLAQAQANGGKRAWLTDVDRQSTHSGANGAQYRAAGTFSAAGDFSSTSNPNGAWSYGYTTTLGGTFTAYSTSGTTVYSGEVGWFGPIPGPTAPGFPLVVATVPNPQVLDLGPGPSTYTVVRWTAPSKGRWDVIGQFFGTGGTTADVHVLRNGVPLFNSPLNGSDLQGFSLVVQANPGDTVDFVAGPGPNGDNDGDPTGFRASIGQHRYDFTTIDVPGSSDTRVIGINDQGDVVGRYNDNTGTHGFSLSQGVFTTIDVPNSSLTVARGISASGRIAGSSVDQNGINHGFVMDRGTLSGLDFPGAADTDILGINNLGSMVGALDYGDQATAIGVQLRGNQASTFEVPGSAPGSTVATGINDLGAIVGSYTDGANADISHAFLFDGTRFSTIDIPGSDNSDIEGINNLGDVSGSCFCIDGLSHGFVRSRGTYTVTDYPVADSRTRVRGINNRGQVVGFYRPNGVGPFHGFIATPAATQ